MYRHRLTQAINSRPANASLLSMETFLSMETSLRMKEMQCGL